MDENIDAINEAMKEAKFKKAEMVKLEIKPEDTRKMKELVKVLDVLEEGITLIVENILPQEVLFYPSFTSSTSFWR